MSKKCNTAFTISAICAFVALWFAFFAALAAFTSCDTRLSSKILHIRQDDDDNFSCVYDVMYDWQGQNLTSWVIDQCPYNKSSLQILEICFSRRNPSSISPGDSTYITYSLGSVFFAIFYIILSIFYYFDRWHHSDCLSMQSYQLVFGV